MLANTPEDIAAVAVECDAVCGWRKWVALEVLREARALLDGKGGGGEQQDAKA